MDRRHANEISHSSKVVFSKGKFVRTNNKKWFGEVFAILCPRAEMVKKRTKNKIKPALFVLPVRLRYRHISYQLIARFCHFSHFLFNLKKTTMNLLAVVKINSMTFTDRNLYTYKKIRFPFRNNYTWAANFLGVDNIVCFEIRISNHTQTHHKIHETLACRQR